LALLAPPPFVQRTFKAFRSPSNRLAGNAPGWLGIIPLAYRPLPAKVPHPRRPLINLSFEFCLVQHGRGELLHRFADGIEIGNSFAPHQLFRCADLVFAIPERGTFTVGLALAPPLMQA
jgi:hypothetical protein